MRFEKEEEEEEEEKKHWGPKFNHVLKRRQDMGKTERKKERKRDKESERKRD